ncbi:hypothetical protein L5515_018749 [Caenorhabditis briggsae]|nr:hypothetical protein L5515_018749 [Caenorhabditis briggsae]
MDLSNLSLFNQSTSIFSALNEPNQTIDTDLKDLVLRYISCLVNGTPTSASTSTPLSTSIVESQSLPPPAPLDIKNPLMELFKLTSDPQFIKPLPFPRIPRDSPSPEPPQYETIEMITEPDDTWMPRPKKPIFKKPEASAAPRHRRRKRRIEAQKRSQLEDEENSSDCIVVYDAEAERRYVASMLPVSNLSPSSLIADKDAPVAPTAPAISSAAASVPASSSSAANAPTTSTPTEPEPVTLNKRRHTEILSSFENWKIKHCLTDYPIIHRNAILEMRMAKIRKESTDQIIKDLQRYKSLMRTVKISHETTTALLMATVSLQADLDAKEKEYDPEVFYNYMKSMSEKRMIMPFWTRKVPSFEVMKKTIAEAWDKVNTSTLFPYQKQYLIQHMQNDWSHPGDILEDIERLANALSLDERKIRQLIINARNQLKNLIERRKYFWDLDDRPSLV